MFTMPWEEFEHMHVIRRFRQVLGAWWKLDLILTDEWGEPRNWDNRRISYVNPATPFLLAKPVVREELKKFINRCLEEVRMDQATHGVRRWDLLGFELAVFPIILDQDILGSVVFWAFLTQEPSSEALDYIRDRLAAFGLSAQDVANALSAIKVLSSRDLEHVAHLGFLLTDEIITLLVQLEKSKPQSPWRLSYESVDPQGRTRYFDIIGKSKLMQSLYVLIDRIKSSESHVLIEGENGVGKDLVAQAIHKSSSRADKPFVAVNCAAFNDNLLESELFGHVRGAFTGAIRDKKGLLEMAHEGTLFLDEVGEMSPSMQAKLLRFLQDGTFTPVGSVEVKKVNVRIISATNRNLLEMVKNGQFREDLYYRLNVIHIKIPPLRDRRDDIPLLAEHFLQKFAVTHHTPRKVLTQRALELLMQYDWPGNVRELQNEIERACVLAGESHKITHDMLSSKIVQGENHLDAAQWESFLKPGKSLNEILESVEKMVILDALRRFGWNRSKVAKHLKMSRASLIQKIQKYGLDKKRVLKAESA